MIQLPPSPIGHIIPRHAAVAVEEALSDTRVVLVNGARQSGKSTLVQQVGKERGAEWLSLDDPETRRAAVYDPTGFVRGDGLMIIDEIQRDPELLLSIKSTVDREGRPGRFLLTGSARVMGLRNLPDTLVGRMETIELWPLSQGEIGGTPDGFIDAVFEQGPEFRYRSEENRKGYIERVVRGGFPEAVARTVKRRSQFFDSYLSDLVNRDVMQLSEISRGPQMRALIKLLAGRSGQLLVPNNLAKLLEAPKDTIKRYLYLLEEVFLIKTIPAWTRNVSSRAVSTRKVAMVDSGLAAHLLKLDAHSLRRPGDPFGPVLEGFVSMEIARQLTWSDARAEMFHYRTKDQIEVDIVLEGPRNQVVAFEIKAGDTIRSDDFRGLRHLEQRLGDDFLLGVVLHTGDKTLPFGPKMRAIPIAAIWETGER